MCMQHAIVYLNSWYILVLLILKYHTADTRLMWGYSVAVLPCIIRRAYAKFNDKHTYWHMLRLLHNDVSQSVDFLSWQQKLVCFLAVKYHCKEIEDSVIMYEGSMKVQAVQGINWNSLSCIDVYIVVLACVRKLRGITRVVYISMLAVLLTTPSPSMRRRGSVNAPAEALALWG